MSLKDWFLARLGRQPLRLAERALRQGRKALAAQLFARGGDFSRALWLAAEAGDERATIEYAFRSAIGRLPEDSRGMDVRLAGEWLAKAEHPREAMALFELAQAYRRAAECALAVRDYAYGGRLFEKARAYPEAAFNYERVGLIQDALRAVEAQRKQLEEGGRLRLESTAEEARLKLDAKRAELLARLGKKAESVLETSAAGPKPDPSTLEQAGRYREAIDAYLESGDPQQALRLLPKAPDLDRRTTAQIYLRAGRPADAAVTYASLGMASDAAQAFEAAGDFAKAGSRWEAARQPPARRLGLPARRATGGRGALL